MAWYIHLWIGHHWSSLFIGPQCPATRTGSTNNAACNLHFKYSTSVQCLKPWGQGLRAIKLSVKFDQRSTVLCCPKHCAALTLPALTTWHTCGINNVFTPHRTINTNGGLHVPLASPNKLGKFIPYLGHHSSCHNIHTYMYLGHASRVILLLTQIEPVWNVNAWKLLINSDVISKIS